MNNIFITGIGTGVGKTVVSACVTEALDALYWKPVQAGLEEGTDAQTIASLISRPASVLPELYRLKMPASPHLAARHENIIIQEDHILTRAAELQQLGSNLVIEGAGGLMVPFNGNYFTIDLIKALGATVIIAAKNYLGSINHCMLTAMALRQAGIPVAGWIFSGDHHPNEDDVISWSNYPRISRLPQAAELNRQFVALQADLMRPRLQQMLSQ